MIMKATDKDVVCPVGANLLVRFKQGKGPTPGAGQQRPRKCDFKDDETTVRIP